MDQKIVQAFLADAIKICGRGKELISELEHQASLFQMSQASVRAFSQTLHSLKGMVQMIPDVGSWTAVLHQFETRAQFHPKRIEWLPEAKRLIEDLAGDLEFFRLKSRHGAGPVQEPEAQGIMVKVDEKLTAWFPITKIERVLLPEELSAILEGSSTQTVGVSSPHEKGKFGLSIRAEFQEGQTYIIEVQAVLGVVAWSEASRRGARKGMDLLSPKKAA